MTIPFSEPIADAKNYPVPNIGGLPKVRDNSAVSERALPALEHHILYTDSARTALYLIAAKLDNRTVWVPSYHCPALVEPFLAAGLEVCFYPITQDLKPDFEFLVKHVKLGEHLIAVRFFGFDTGISELSEFCNNNNNLLIEDLAHAAFPSQLFGQVAVTSLVKFYPLASGSELILNKRFVLANKILRGHKNLSFQFTARVVNVVKKIIKKLGLPVSAKWRYLDFSSMRNHISSADQHTLRTTDHSQSQMIRRKNYQLLAENLANSKYGSALFPYLDELTVPYIFPFLIDNESTFDKLRGEGIQIYRWEELAQTHCKISSLYRQKLIQIPCHQDITTEDIDYITNILSQ